MFEVAWLLQKSAEPGMLTGCEQDAEHDEILAGLSKLILKLAALLYKREKGSLEFRSSFEVSMGST
eukprot:2781842-Amphidinium_carterae.1